MTAQRGTGHATVVTLTIELVGIGLMAALAETGPKMGRLMVSLMAGFMVLWLLINANYFAGFIGKVNQSAKT